jgi:hypothetical protein
MFIIRYLMADRMKEHRKGLAHGMHIELSWVGGLEGKRPSECS